MIDGIAVNDVKKKIEEYKQKPNSWINLEHFYNETRREIEGRVEQHHYFAIDADKALEELEKFYHTQLGDESRNSETKDDVER